MVKKLFLIAALFSQAAFAGQYAQQLSDCAYNNLNFQDKKILTQWAFVSLGKTKAAKEVTVIPAQKIKDIEAKGKAVMTSIVTERCGKEMAKVALYETKDGFKEAGSDLALRLAKDEMGSKLDSIFPKITDQGSLNVMKAGEVLDGFFKKIR
ncbi:hypothetical protein [Turicimonas muris]|uniref:hypothetical protein n=1 Tax=Turicimonas muris TaxID=1796652 RepID=UPI0023F29B34|nr:hypothetical protein [Turicimonas muris]